MGDDEHPFGDLLASSTTEAWSGGVGRLDEWSRDAWSRIDGYRRAAKMLAEAATREDNWWVSDRLVFPIVFLYRHALELQVKECIANGNAYLGGQPAAPYLHDFEALWDEFLEIAERCGFRGSGDDWQHTEWVIQRLQAVDNASGTAWRYSFDRDGPLLPDDGRLIDVAHLSGHLERALDTLDGWQSGLDVRRDYMREQYDYRP